MNTSYTQFNSKINKFITQEFIIFVLHYGRKKKLFKLNVNEIGDMQYVTNKMNENKETEPISNKSSYTKLQLEISFSPNDSGYARETVNEMCIKLTVLFTVLHFLTSQSARVVQYIYIYHSINTPIVSTIGHQCVTSNFRFIMFQHLMVYGACNEVFCL